jgi:hypothetical protein
MRRPATSEDRDHRICEPLVNGITLEEEGFELISDFRRWAQVNHVRVMAGFPSMADRKEYDSATVEGVEEKLNKYFNNEGIYVVGGIREVLLPQFDFFDTIYHPTEEVSILRSRSLAVQLRPMIGFARR